MSIYSCPCYDDAVDMHREADFYIESCGEYTGQFEREKVLRDWAAKDRVAEKIVEDFERRAGRVAGKTLLDAGFGNGAFCAAFAKSGAIVSGIEVNSTLFELALERMRERGMSADLRLYAGEEFPYADKAFDFVYSTSVLEHVSDPTLFLREIGRVLKDGGRAYLSFPNRLAPRETHTGIWFLSYLPRSAARMFLRVFFNRDTIDEINLHFISYPKFLRLLQGTGLRVLPELESHSAARSFLKRLLFGLGFHQSAILKTVAVILEK